jgi:tol-pal system protein YbgF
VSADLWGKNTELIFMGIKSTFLAALLLSGSTAPGLALESNLPGVRLEAMAGNSIPLPQTEIQGEAPVLLAQDATGNVQLEEQIRLLNGKVEELTFQILQMQEQVRKLQEDNEFRFQELEKSKQGAAAPKAKPADDTEQAAEETPKDPDKVRVVTTDNAGNGDSVADVIDGTKGAGAPAQDLGAVKFDENGNPIGATAAPDKVAAIPPSDNPAELYKTAYEHILSGEYPSAEAAFRAHIKNFPADPQTADARYWLGESLIGQERYRDAAEVLLKAQKEYPKSKKAPDMLLKLGVSLSALDNKDVACATFAQVSKKYPRAAPAVIERVAAEQAKAGC